MARKPTEADLLAAELERQLAALEATNPTPTKTSKAASTPGFSPVNTYEEAVAAMSGISDPVLKSTLEKITSGISAQTAKVTEMASNIGYNIDTSTGVLTPKTTTGQQSVPQVQQLASTKTLASDTFANTFALIFGSKEASQPYVQKLYGLVSGFYNSGSTIDESLNLALRQARETNAIPEFTKRFAGLFALEDKFKAGEAVTVPTIAQFFATEAKMGEILTQAGLGDLATQDFLGQVIGQNKSAIEVSNLINDVFNTIDNAPKAVKDTLSTYFPGVDRASIAKAILTGEQGAQELSNKVKGIQVLAAGKQQGVDVSLAQAQDIANQGYDYNQALAGFGQVKSLERANTIAQFGGTQFSQEQAQQAVFGKSIEQQNILDQLRAQESGRFQGSAGTTKGAFSTGYLNKQSSAGLF